MDFCELESVIVIFNLSDIDPIRVSGSARDYQLRVNQTAQCISNHFP